MISRRTLYAVAIGAMVGSIIAGLRDGNWHDASTRALLALILWVLAERD